MIFFLLALILSCQPSTSWYPNGTATLENWYEIDDSGVETLVVTIMVDNTGTTSINRATFSLKAETAVRTYYETTVSELHLIPGSSAFVTVSLPYADVAERLKTNGITVMNAFFE